VVAENDKVARAVLAAMRTVTDVITTAAAAAEPEPEPKELKPLRQLRRLCSGKLDQQLLALREFDANHCNVLLTYQDVCAGASVSPDATVVLLGNTTASTPWGVTVTKQNDGMLARRLRPRRIVNAVWCIPDV
jgi:hypothetical protein